MKSMGLKAFAIGLEPVTPQWLNPQQEGRHDQPGCDTTRPKAKLGVSFTLDKSWDNVSDQGAVTLVALGEAHNPWQSPAA